MSLSKTVTRHRTIPMTKRESVSTSGSRLSLISNNSNPSNQRHVDVKDSNNSNAANNVERKRTKKVKRNESYKQAIIELEKLSVYDGGSDDLLNESKDSAAAKRRVNDVGRRKYNTLPVRAESNNNVIQTLNNKSKTEKRSQFVIRNSSVKSGTFPSPDTDDDQRSVEPERKKKTTFKRFKERLALTFKRDEGERQRRNEKRRNSKKHAGDVHKHVPRKTLKSGSYDSSKGLANGGTHSNHKPVINGHNGAVRTQGTGTRVDTEVSPGKIRKDLNLFQSFKESFRRKSPPQVRRKGDSNHIMNNDIHRSGQSNSSTRYTKVIQGCRDGQEQRETNYSARKHEDKRYQSSDRNKTVKSAGACVDVLEGSFEEGGNLTTDIFGAIIDPSYPTSPRQQPWGRQGPFHEQDFSKRVSGERVAGSKRRPDTSNLRLEGLRKCRPRSFDNTPQPVSTSQTRTGETRRGETTVADVHYSRRYNDLSPDVEFDGPDYADGVVTTPDEDLSELSDAFIDADDHRKKVHNVAQCLKVIADKVAEEKRRKVNEDEIVKALREIADEIDKQKFQGKNFPAGVPKELLPVLKNMIIAQSYASFSHVIQQALNETAGWEQVAWYTFLTKSALQVASVGQDASRKVRSRALRYFNSSIRPWVESRPYGWESIHEETDVESELD